MIRSRKLNRRLALLTSALMVAPSGAFANPLGGQVVGGSATIQGQGTNSVTVNQTSGNAIINWNTFNIGRGEITQFVQPSASSIALNRVIGGGGASTIDGLLTANGKVFLINPNGVVIGSGGVVNTAGFLATTHDIANADFMAGRYNFTIPGNPNASVVNLGNITVTPGSSGFAALVAPGVRNAGVITANLGQVGLASSGSGFTLDFYGDKLITLQVGDKVANQVIDVATGEPLKSLVSNEGKIKANGGQVTLTAAEARTIVYSVINNTGVIEANSVGTRNGMIVLGAASSTSTDAPRQNVNVSGRLSARGRHSGEKGGTIQITGEQIALNNAKVDASGQAGGGTVRVGDRTMTKSVSVDAATNIDVSAKTQGNGGTASVLSGGLATVNGTILAMGGAHGGNGGFVETSGETVSFAGIHVDTSAVAGTTGMWLIDPTNLVIDREDAATIAQMLASSNVTLTTTADGASGPADHRRGAGDIIVDSSITWSSANTLTFNAYHDIDIHSSVNGASGGLMLTAGHDINVGGSVNVAAFTLNAGHDISATKSVDVGTFTLQNGFWSQVDWKLPTFSATDFRITGGTFLRASGGNGSTWSPYRITDVYGLQGIGSPSGRLLSKNFVLGNDIDASGTAGWNTSTAGSQGFVPIGQPNSGFTGSFDGRGHAISNLTIAPTDSRIASIGLFGANYGAISNVSLTDVRIAANTNDNVSNQFVGTLVGQNFGMITDVTVTGTVDGGTGAGVVAGGLVGQNNRGQFVRTWGYDEEGSHQTFVPAVIANSSADVAVTVASGNTNGQWNYAGGLAGINQGMILGSHAIGAVASGSDSFAGGLVGANQTIVTQNTASQDGFSLKVAGFDSSDRMFGPVIFDSYAAGAVSSQGTAVSLGGLVGFNGIGSAIVNSRASGNVLASADSVAGTNGTNFAGGLVGQNDGWIGTYQTRSHRGDSEENVKGFGGNGGCGFGATCATGQVAAGAGGVAGGLVGNNSSTGVISHASAQGGTVSTDNPNGNTVSVGANGTAGGLVGQNDGIIWKSFAIVDVTGAAGTGVGNHGKTFLGGLVGDNEGFIGRSFAGGAVGTAGTDNLEVGGLVAFNGGTIRRSHASGEINAGNGSTAGGLAAENDAGAHISRSSSSSDVTVGDSSAAGGLVGINSGTVSRSRASGAVIAGNNSFAGGLAAANNSDGLIRRSSSSSDVTVGTQGTAGGLVGENFGAVSRSRASGGSVIADASSIVGGLVGFNNGGNIWRSSSSIDVTAGNNSFAGGLVGENRAVTTTQTNCEECQTTTTGGMIARSHASGTVTVGAQSAAGGFVGVNDVNSLIRLSGASGDVASTGTNSIVGGFAGLNGGTVDHSQSTGSVSGTSSSFVGGFVGVNIGSVIESHVTGKNAVVGVNGTNNVVGGFVGMNIGLIDPSSTSATLDANGNTNVVGNFAGANLQFAVSDFPIALQPLLPAPTFMVGSIKDAPPNPTDPLNQQHPFIGTEGPTAALPTAPPSGGGSNGGDCISCTLIAALPSPPPPNIPPSDQNTNTPTTPDTPPPPNTQIVPPPSNFGTQPTNINLNFNPTPPSGGGAGGAGGNGGNGGAGGPPNAGPPPGPGIGRTLSEQQFSGVPPIGETRFRSGEVVVQVVNTIPTADVLRIAQQLGMTLISSQDIAGRVIYRFTAGDGKDVRKLILALEKQQIVASAQPNYVFVMAQAPSPPQVAAPQTIPAVPPPAATNPPPAAGDKNDTTGAIPPPSEVAPELSNADTAALQSLPAGDAAQYVIDKLHLSAVHRLASGRNVSVAVIDSEIDAQHPDLRGVIAERYDTTKSESHPHSHGTGMAGAIASRYKLLGVAPGVKLLAIKAFDESATSAEATSYAILKGLDYAMSKNVRIINMSFAGPHDPMMERSLKTAHDKGIILIAAAGNAGPKSPPLYPGADASVIAVTATDYSDKPFAMANRGKYIAVAAPGVDVMVPAPGNSYQLTTGTSVAAAHVSGVAALLVENKPGITPDEVRAVLMKTAKAMNVKGKDELDGSGLVDPVGALQALNPGRAAEILQRINGASLSR